MSTHNSDYVDLDAPSGLQLDLLSAIVRIQQLQDEEPPDHYLWGRIVTCDVVRLRQYLEPATLEWVEAKGNEDVSEILAEPAGDPAAESFARQTVNEMMPDGFAEEHPSSALALLASKYEVHNAVANEAARQRALLVHKLHEAGRSWAELGEWMGTTRARAQQLGRSGAQYAKVAG